VTSPESPDKHRRGGSAADRGKGRSRVLNFPPPPPAPANVWQALWRIGPGIITGAADLDPSAVITCTLTGAAFSFSMLWVVVLCIPFLLTIFSVTARIGTETRRGLLDLVRQHYGVRWALIGATLTILTNIAIIVADLMAVTDAFSILLNQARPFFITMAAFSVWYILIFRDYRKITRVLVLLSLPLYLYVAAAILVAPEPRTLLIRIFLPHAAFNREYVEGVIAVFGSLLTPYILLWQVSSRSDPEHEPSRADTHAATLVSILLSFCIIVTAGSVLHLAHPTNMTTRQAAEALSPIVGHWGTMLFAVGIVGAGMVALPVLTASMCYDLAQAMEWKYGLSEQPWDAPLFYALISGSMFLAGVANYFHINPVKALYWSMVLAGILIIPTLLFILFVSNDRRIMRTVNTRMQNFWIGASCGAIATSALAGLWWKFR
jgi:Mn2+/Fe2+ NRAMP family transporter